MKKEKGLCRFASYTVFKNFQHYSSVLSASFSLKPDDIVQGGSNMTGTDLCVNKPHCAAAVQPLESEATTSTLPPARVRTCSVLSGSC